MIKVSENTVTELGGFRRLILFSSKASVLTEKVFKLLFSCNSVTFISSFHVLELLAFFLFQV